MSQLLEVDHPTRNTLLNKLWKAMRFRGWDASIDDSDRNCMPELRLVFLLGHQRLEYIIRINRQGQQVVTQVGLGPHGIGWREIYNTENQYSSCIEFFNHIRKEYPYDT